MTRKWVLWEKGAVRQEKEGVACKWLFRSIAPYSTCGGLGSDGVGSWLGSREADAVPATARPPMTQNQVAHDLISKTGLGTLKMLSSNSDGAIERSYEVMPPNLVARACCLDKTS